MAAHSFSWQPLGPMNGGGYGRSGPKEGPDRGPCPAYDPLTAVIVPQVQKEAAGLGYGSSNRYP